MPVDEFVEILCDKLELLRPHCFIASEQARFFKECKSNLVPGEVLVTADYSENYSFVLQDAAQGTIGIMHRPPFTPLLPITQMLKGYAI